MPRGRHYDPREGDCWNGINDPAHLLCCFCARPLSGLRAIEVTINYPDASWMPLWAHVDCLTAKLHPAVPVRRRRRKNRPNKAPEPTPGLVTSRAEVVSEMVSSRKARLAPSPVVAHL